MSDYLNQILYNNTKFDSPDTIKLLEPFMHTKYVDTPIPIVSHSTLSHSTLSHSTLSHSTLSHPPTVAENPTINSPLLVETVNSNIICPHNTDTLFWCLYIAKNEYIEYINLNSKYKNKEIEQKQEMINTIKKSPAILKSTSRKVTNVAIQEIMSELMIDKKTSYKTFFAQCVLNEMNMYIVDKTTGTFLRFAYCHDLSKNNYIIYRSIDGFFSIDIEEKTSDQITNLTASWFELEHGDKPLKSISTYKVCDLEIISKQLGLFEDTKKYKKQDLYDGIMGKCKWTVQ